MTGGERLQWDRLLRIAFGWLGLSPGDFWAMTPREFCLAFEGWMELRGLRSDGLSPEELENLQAFLEEA